MSITEIIAKMMKLLNTCALIKPKVTVTNCLIMELILTEGLQN